MMSTKIRRRRTWATLTVDLILEIVARSDVTTVVRSAATCRIVRAAILAPYFNRLVLQLQEAADGGGFDPSGLVLGVTYNDSKIRVIHIPDASSIPRRRVRLDTGSIQQRFEPLAARDGLFLLRHRHESNPGPGPASLRVCNTLTGHVRDIPPAAVPDIPGPHILLSVGDGDNGGSFQLYVVDNIMRFQIFSSNDDTWGVVRKASISQCMRQHFGSVVVGRTIYWLCQLNIWRNYDTILALDTDAAETTLMKLPGGCVVSRMMQCKDYINKHFLLCLGAWSAELARHGEPRDIMWTFTPASSGLAATWNRLLMIGVTEMLRQAGLDDSFRLISTPFNLEGFGERSGSLILSLGLGQLFRLDTKSKEAIVFKRLTRPGNVCVSQTCSCMRQI